jgi:hypothetical protein
MKRLALLVVLAPHVAAADPKPDRAVAAAGDANLESDSRRKGIILQAGIGGGLMLGIGVDGVTGNGPSGSFRIGHVATRNSLVTLELSTVTLRHAVNATMDSDQYIDQDTSIMLGGQFYINPALWLRVAAGIGGYRGKHVGENALDVSLTGPAGAVGAGVEVIRFKRWAIGLEMFTVGMINRDGLMSSTGFLVDAILY